MAWSTEARTETDADPRSGSLEGPFRVGSVNRMTLVGPASRDWAVLYGWRLRRSVRGFVQRERALAEDA